jgi:hypothetical protein
VAPASADFLTPAPAGAEATSNLYVSRASS